jgi:polyphosphate kinase
MKRARYETELGKLQVQLARAQAWIKEKRLRVVIVFEGRDGAGKGGTIRALTERLSPRVFRVAALRTRKSSCRNVRRKALTAT